jgi:hypothetical protein
MSAFTSTDALRDYLNRWAGGRFSCEPADRNTAEKGVRLAYAAAGLAQPQHIIWCGGPLEIAKKLAMARADDSIGANVRAAIFDCVQNRIGTLAEIFWKDTLTAATDSGGGETTAPVARFKTYKGVCKAINEAVRRDADDLLCRFSTRARHLSQRLRGMPRLLPRYSFDEVAIGPDQLASLAVYQYLYDVLAWRDPARRLRGLWKVAKSASWVVPHKHVCWIADRPSIIRTDAQGRLHCAHGPALQYRDGWSAWAWKGVQVPAWVIEHSERITVSTLANVLDPRCRRCLIEIMTPERLIATGAASRVSHDETGTLWRMTWYYRGVRLDAWSAVEVVDATLEPDGSRKRYFLSVPVNMRSAREAVAWTYGLTAKQYEALEMRT